MANCVEKHNRLKSTTSNQQNIAQYKLGNTIVMKTITKQ